MPGVFNPESVGKMCKEFGQDQWLAMDIKSGYDCDRADDRKRGWGVVMRDKPTLVIGSPPCTMFFRFQELNQFMYNSDREWMHT